jgi:hypothetical protein
MDLRTCISRAAGSQSQNLPAVVNDAQQLQEMSLIARERLVTNSGGLGRKKARDAWKRKSKHDDEQIKQLIV